MASVPKVSIYVRTAGGVAGRRTLDGLSAASQRNVSRRDYEVIGSNVSPAEKWAARAMRHALSDSRAPLLGFFGGSPIVTPRLVEHALAAVRSFANPIICVPEYVRDEEAGEAEGADGRGASGPVHSTYDLFEASRFARSHERGYLAGVLESEAFFCTRAMFRDALGGKGIGGVETLDQLFARLLGQKSNRLVVLGGEGAFRHLPTPAEPPEDLWSRSERQPTLFGVVPGQAQRAFRESISYALMHQVLVRDAGRDEWPDDGTSTIPRAKKRGRAISSPKLSIVVVAYKARRQVLNTLHSLSARHQWNVGEDAYEVLVVENRSSDMLGESRVRRLGANFRYILRDESGVSPAPALNYGVSQARGAFIGLLIDGARMATPRVVEHALAAARGHDRPLIAVPGYHLGPGQQHLTSLQGYDESAEQKLLREIDWKRDGYRLFEISCLDDATKNGFFNPLLEATYLFTSKACFDEVGGLDERFDLAGGGEVNHDLFHRLCRLPKTRYIVLWGEGNFHQYHGGVSTSAEDREQKLERFRKQYDAIRGHRFRTFEREPRLLGTYAAPGQAKFMEAGLLGRLRFSLRRAEGREEWENG